MSTKVCRACCNEKSLDEFTKDKSQKSGLNSKCKDCMREYNRAYYAENKQRMQDYHRDYQRDYQRWRYQNNISGAKDYHKKPDVLKRKIARDKVAAGVRTGKIWKSPCCMAEGCYNTERLEAHHHCYDSPENVTWLCTFCHAHLHAEHDKLK